MYPSVYPARVASVQVSVWIMPTWGRIAHAQSPDRVASNGNDKEGGSGKQEPRGRHKAGDGERGGSTRRDPTVNESANLRYQPGVGLGVCESIYTPVRGVYLDMMRAPRGKDGYRKRCKLR